ncbi:MAG: hypothetical protein RIC24_03560 [Hyphomicrobiales bacterium]|jgi:hypothetical protein
MPSLTIGHSILRQEIVQLDKGSTRFMSAPGSPIVAIDRDAVALRPVGTSSRGGGAFLLSTLSFAAAAYNLVSAAAAVENPASIYTRHTNGLNFLYFGNRYSMINPTDVMNEETIKHCIRRHGQTINGLKINKIERLVANACIIVMDIPSRSMAASADINRSGMQCANPDDLVAFLVLFCALT